MRPDNQAMWLFLADDLAERLGLILGQECEQLEPSPGLDLDPDDFSAWDVHDLGALGFEVEGHPDIGPRPALGASDGRTFVAWCRQCDALFRSDLAPHQRHRGVHCGCVPF